MTKLEILEKEHEIINVAFEEWIYALKSDELPNAVGYIDGINALADALIKGEESVE